MLWGPSRGVQAWLNCAATLRSWSSSLCRIWLHNTTALMLWMLFFQSSEIKKKTVLRTVFLVAEETHTLHCVTPSKQLRLFQFNTTPKVIIGLPNIHVSILGLSCENKEYQSVHKDKLPLMPNHWLFGLFFLSCVFTAQFWPQHSIVEIRKLHRALWSCVQSDQVFHLLFLVGSCVVEFLIKDDVAFLTWQNCSHTKI